MDKRFFVGGYGGVVDMVVCYICVVDGERVGLFWESFEKLDNFSVEFFIIEGYDEFFKYVCVRFGGLESGCYLYGGECILVVSV